MDWEIVVGSIGRSVAWVGTEWAWVRVWETGEQLAGRAGGGGG